MTTAREEAATANRKQQSMSDSNACQVSWVRCSSWK